MSPPAQPWGLLAALGRSSIALVSSAKPSSSTQTGTRASSLVLRTRKKLLPGGPNRREHPGVERDELVDEGGNDHPKAPHFDPTRLMPR